MKHELSESEKKFIRVHPGAVAAILYLMIGAMLTVVALIGYAVYKLFGG